LVEGEGFEPSKAEPSDLQSDPFDRSGTPPNRTRDYDDQQHGCQTELAVIDQIMVKIYVIKRFSPFRAPITCSARWYRIVKYRKAIIRQTI
jgi:hypothetical protein